MICRDSTGTVELRYVNTLLNATYSNFQGLLRSLFFLGGPGAGTCGDRRGSQRAAPLQSLTGRNGIVIGLLTKELSGDAFLYEAARPRTRNWRDPLQPRYGAD